MRDPSACGDPLLFTKITRTPPMGQIICAVLTVRWRNIMSCGMEKKLNFKSNKVIVKSLIHRRDEARNSHFYRSGIVPTSHHWSIWIIYSFSNDNSSMK